MKATVGRATFVILLTAALPSTESVTAHSGPPFPILSNRIAGAYDISIWSDPDTTDDGSPGGQFWVVLKAVGRGPAIPAATVVTVAIRPLDRDGPTRTGQARPVNGAAGNQFVALLMDHEGGFGVRVTVDSPLGRAEVESRAEATYDLRPARGLIVIYLLPFVAVGALWMKVLWRRRHAGGGGAFRGTRGNSRAGEL
jgi:hypothetical protein